MGDFVYMKIYCPNCRKSIDIKNMKNVKMSYGRTAVEHVCPKCGTKIYAVRQ